MSTVAESDEKITCQIDGAKTHSIAHYLKNHHPDWTLERYRTEFPDAPILSEKAQRMANKIRAEKAAGAADGAAVAQNTSSEAGETTNEGFARRKFHEVFGFDESTPGVTSTRGGPIVIKTLTDLDAEAQALVPDIDKRYVFQPDLCKVVIMGLELNIPTYLWGYHGTGKTTILEQVAARTNRPFMRVQHTVNTEESHIIGQYIVKDQSTIFQPGPLTLAMVNGYVYCADEYDFAMPSVLSVYQPVLEGKALVIKDAPPEFRIVRPHENFRFVATGNTNGGGDETGLYQGTQMQNAANYSRFGIVEEVGYMDPRIETAVVAQQTGIKTADASKLVKFAGDVRTAFAAGKIGTTVSPRELINAARIGLVRGSDWRGGLKLAFANRCSRVDKEAVEQVAQRVFG